MPYQAEISRANPTLVMLVLDQSGSMSDAFGGDASGGLRKAQFLADVVNKTLYDLVLRCTRADEIRNYYNVAIVGYGEGVGFAFGGNLAGRDIVPVSELADNPIRVDTRAKKVPDGAGGLVEQQVRFPVWVEAVAANGTPMVAALQQVEQVLAKWFSDPQHKMCFPPTVLHITDGESSDGDPSEMARKIMAVTSTDGNTLLYNCHISSDRAAKVEYPSSAEGLANALAQTLFNVSTVLPEKFIEAGKQVGLPLQPGARGFVFNADANALVQFFDIGTRPANLR